MNKVYAQKRQLLQDQYSTPDQSIFYPLFKTLFQLTIIQKMLFKYILWRFGYSIPACQKAPNLSLYFFAIFYLFSVNKEGLLNKSYLVPAKIQKMIKNIVFVLLLACFCSSFKPCEPFGPRIFYGHQIKNSSSSEKLLIYFNTASACQSSYAQIVLKSGFVKVQCTTTALKLSDKTKNYETHIHKCGTDKIEYQETFNYNVFGWDGSAANPIPFADYVQVTLANPSNKSRSVKFVVLADWSKIEVNLKKYTPIDTMMLGLQKSEHINGLIILGDIGYDLDTNNCLNYQKFLVMLSQTAAALPILMITGNHQYNTKDNWSLYSESFEVYGLATELAVGINLGALHLVPFDPYSLLYNTTSTDKVASKLDTILKAAKSSGRFVVPASHYPLACSGTSKNCKNDRTTMKTYWDSMIDNGVSLYLGAHYHTYQRIFPYTKGDKFTNQKQNYESDKGYLISIVEGVAGNDRDIVQSIDKIQAFTASHTVNETGFGVLQVNAQNVSYRHISTAKGEMDKISIAWLKAKGQNKQIQLSTQQ